MLLCYLIRRFAIFGFVWARYVPKKMLHLFTGMKVYGREVAFYFICAVIKMLIILCELVYLYN